MKVSPNFDILKKHFKFIPIKLFWSPEVVENGDEYAYRKFLRSRIDNLANQADFRNYRKKIIKNTDNLVAIHNYMMHAFSPETSNSLIKYFENYKEWLKLRKFFQDFDVEDNDEYEISIIVKSVSNIYSSEKTVLISILPPRFNLPFFEMFKAEFPKSPFKTQISPTGPTFKRNIILQEFESFIQKEIGMRYKKSAYGFMIVFFDLTNLKRLLGVLTPETIKKALKTLE